eukprot:181684-Pelagomonas_calceolata.AAC.4
MKQSRPARLLNQDALKPFPSNMHPKMFPSNTHPSLFLPPCIQACPPTLHLSIAHQPTKLSPSRTPYLTCVILSSTHRCMEVFAQRHQRCTDCLRAFVQPVTLPGICVHQAALGGQQPLSLALNGRQRIMHLLSATSNAAAACVQLLRGGCRARSRSAMPGAVQPCPQ